MKISLCTISFRHQLIDLKDIAFWARDTGFQGIELWGVHGGQPGDIARHDIVRTIGDDGFKDFNRQPFGGQLKTVQLPTHLVHQPGIAQLVRGKIDSDPRHVDAGAVPRLERGESMSPVQSTTVR